MTVRRSHEIASDVRARIVQRLDCVADVLVHVELAPSGRASYSCICDLRRYAAMTIPATPIPVRNVVAGSGTPETGVVAAGISKEGSPCVKLMSSV